MATNQVWKTVQKFPTILGRIRPVSSTDDQVLSAVDKVMSGSNPQQLFNEYKDIQWPLTTAMSYLSDKEQGVDDLELDQAYSDLSSKLKSWLLNKISNLKSAKPTTTSEAIDYSSFNFSDFSDEEKIVLGKMRSEGYSKEEAIKQVMDTRDTLKSQVDTSPQEEWSQWWWRGLANTASSVFGDWGVGERANPVGKIVEIADDLMQKIPTMSEEDRDNFAHEKLNPFGRREWIGEGVGAIPTMVVNAIPSFLKLSTAVGRAMTNPLDTIGGIVTLVSTEEGRQAIKDRYWSWEGLSKTMVEDPVGLASDILTILWGGAWLVSKTAKLWGAAKFAEMAGGVSKTALWASDLGIVEGVGKAKGLINDISNPLLKGAAKTITAPTSIKDTTQLLTKTTLSPVLRFALNQITWVNEKTRKFAVENPDVLSQFQKGEITKQTLLDDVQNTFNDLEIQKGKLGEGYNVIRDTELKLNTDDLLPEINSRLSDTKGLEVATNSKGDINMVIPEGKFNPSQKKALDSATSILRDLLKKEKITADDILNARERFDDTLNWENKPTTTSSLDKRTEKIIKEIRRWVDTIAKNEVEGLAKLDNEFSKVVSDISTLRKDRFNSDGSLKDSAISKMNNLANDTNKARLERLEQYIPWIAKKVEALRAIADIDNAMNTKTGTYVRSALMWWSLAMGNIPMVVVGLLLNPENTTRILQTYWKTSARLKERIKKGQWWDEKAIHDIENMVQDITKWDEAMINKIVDDVGFNPAGTASVPTSQKIVNESMGELRIKVEVPQGKGVIDARNSFWQKEIHHLITGMGTKKNNRVIVSNVSENVINKLKDSWEKTIPTVHVINSNELQHAIKRHGVNSKTLSSIEVPLTKSDFKHIPDIIKSPDSVHVSPKKSNRNNTVVVYKKRIGDLYYYLEQVSIDGVLETQTMFKNI